MANESISNSDLSQPQNRTGNRGHSSIGEQAGRVAADVRELGNIALANAGDALETVRHRGTEMLEHGKERVGRAREGFEVYVADNPFKSILIACGVGVLVGYALHSRK
jgi:ElaB/YqjD/DUF883 family membrane-anchored ribosome-binding protein